MLYRFTPLYTKPPRFFFFCVHLFFEGRKEKRRTKKNEKRLGLKNTLKSTKKKCKNMCTFFLRERGEVYFSSALFPPIFNNPFLLLAFRFVSPQRRRRRRRRRERERVSSWLLGTMGVVVEEEEEEDSSRRFHLVKKVVLER